MPRTVGAFTTTTKSGHIGFSDVLARPCMVLPFAARLSRTLNGLTQLGLGNGTDRDRVADETEFPWRVSVVTDPAANSAT